MIDWTVLGSSDFEASFSQHNATFKNEQKAFISMPSGKAAKRLKKALTEFLKLMAFIDGFENKVMPPKGLTFIQNDAMGYPIYSLIHGHWRCLYRVDRNLKTCTAIKIEKMSDALRNVEISRHGYGDKLEGFHD